MRSFFVVPVIFYVIATNAALAQSQQEVDRVIDVFRQNECTLTEETMGREFTSLGMSRDEVEAIIGMLMRSGEVTFNSPNAVLSESVCKDNNSEGLGGTAAALELAASLAHSEQAQRAYIEALFAANGCRLSFSQFQKYLDNVLPLTSFGSASNDIARARLALELLPPLMISEGVLEGESTQQIMVSRGQGCE